MNKRESMKRVLCFILALFVFVGCMPFMSQNVAAVSKSGVASDFDAEETITWEISGTDTVTITFKGSGELPTNRIIARGSFGLDTKENEKDGWRYYKSKIEKVVIGEGITSIGDKIFENFTSLKTVQLPKSLTSIGENAFKGCTNLLGITLHEGIEWIGKSAFAGSGLKKVTIPSTAALMKQEGSSSSAGGQFSGCENLSEVIINNGVSKLPKNLFSGCSNLSSINIPNSVEYIGAAAFYGCSSLKSIVIPASVTSYGSDGSYMVGSTGLFQDCTSLTDVKILSNAAFPNAMFQFCSSLTKVVVPDGIKIIPYSTFNGCTSLKELVLPEGLEIIEQAAIRYTAIKKLTIPGSLTGVYGYAFEETPLTDVYYTGSKLEWELLIEENTNKTANDPLINAKVHFIGWSKDTKGWRYYTSETAYHKNTWKKIDGKWYHFDASGYIQTGWQKLGGSWYYFNPSGHMVHGWYKADGKWYYFGWENDADSGAMRTGWVKADGTWYYMNSSGTMLTGWQTLGGKTYYLKPSGAMAANEYIGGYWLNGNGSWTYPHKATWRKSGNRWWYGDASGWYAKNGTYKIDGTVYKFDASGWMK